MKDGTKKVCRLCNLSWGLEAIPPRCKINDKDRHMTWKDHTLFWRFAERKHGRGKDMIYEDLPFHYIYMLCYGTLPRTSMTTREQQMAIGPYISRLNEKLVPFSLRVVPGVARSSYRLVKSA